MNRVIVAVVLLPLIGQASAQTLIDDPIGIDRALADQITAHVSDQFTDPVATQVRRLRPSDKFEGSVCGEVNTKNQFGGYVGFKPFRYIIDRHKIYMTNTGCE
ncbi:hypothetical protein [Ochrobactrum soli]|uniref:Uncharacterized protein n=1 Tax=Ochrobactrum soli TaxID=2448455 RepID=A0A849KDV4_9HYPH|nr:hypothetical protein [[Ochrobactrum] soli]NNU59725.1 hypothetical protein [[Ochrobactrum] soli]